MTGEHVDDAGARCEAFLRAHLPPEWVDAIDRDDAVALAQARERLDEAQWWIELADAGYVTPTWPVEYGGLGLGAKAGTAVNGVLGRYKVPRSGNPVGVGHAGAALIEWGTDAQKARFLRPIARHEEIWCQLFSEPGAGSDVAGLSTRAVRDGDTWVVNGQKVWTSLGHLASFGLLLARTDPDVPKHRGITAFILPMKAKGVRCGAPDDKLGIRGSKSSQIFLDDVRLPGDALLGEVGGGFKVAMSTLDGGRIGIAAQAIGIARAALEDSLGYAQQRRTFGKPIAQHQAIAFKLADMATEIDAARLLALRAAWLKDHKHPYGKEAAMAKLYASDVANRAAREAIQIFGGNGYVTEFPVERHFRDAKITEIYEGTSEIQRLVIANYLTKGG
jgi:alkylation response protein AidB-like acyl-CoA dehydrogenase